MISRSCWRTGRKVVVIAKSKNSRNRSLRPASQTLAVALTGMFLAGCTSMDIFGSDKVDRSLSTGTVPTAASGATLSDEMTVRNAVTSADLARLGTSPVPWANTSTGSAGVVSTIQENRGSGNVCRNFTTTRHSYEGIAQFSGQACMTGSGDWLLTSFDRQ